jgi:hypothetical protein
MCIVQVMIKSCGRLRPHPAPPNPSPQLPFLSRPPFVPSPVGVSTPPASAAPPTPSPPAPIAGSTLRAYVLAHPTLHSPDLHNQTSLCHARAGGPSPTLLPLHCFLICRSTPSTPPPYHLPLSLVDGSMPQP